MKHLPIALLGFVLCGWVIPIKTVNTYSYAVHGAVLLLLMLVLVMGHTAGGAQRWLNLGFFLLQPSELAKITVACAIAKWAAAGKVPTPFQVVDTWPVAVIIFSLFAMIFLQPDLGTAGVCALIGAAQLLFLINIDRKLVFSTLTGSIMVAFVGWNYLLHPYQKRRVLSLLDPNLDPTGSSYNSLQSLVAVGSGGFWGKGFLNGTQTQLQFLPERHTDFIFSVVAEEHGFIGGTIVFALFTLLIFMGLEIARNAKDMFSSLLAIGIVAFIFIEFTINVAMVLSLFPVVGMPLPLFSKGASSLVTICVGIGLLVAIDRHGLAKARKIKFGRPS